MSEALTTLGGIYNYLIVFALMMIGLYVVVVSSNLIKKVIGLNIFQTSVFILYITFGKVGGGTAPILIDSASAYSNPLPHVLILTAIVVGVATTALGLAIVVRIHAAYGSADDEVLQEIDSERDD